MSHEFEKMSYEEFTACFRKIEETQTMLRDLAELRIGQTDGLVANGVMLGAFALLEQLAGIWRSEHTPWDESEAHP